MSQHLHTHELARTNYRPLPNVNVWDLTVQSDVTNFN